jgi:molybdopterin converting factor small subunit
MAIKVRVTGVFLGHPLNETFEEPYLPDDTPKKVLARLDKKKTLGRKFFSGLIKRRSATFLLNGDRLDPSEASNTHLNEGDEISVLSSIAGG